jgi:hypothetical protein
MCLNRFLHTLQLATTARKEKIGIALVVLLRRLDGKRQRQEQNDQANLDDPQTGMINAIHSSPGR